MALVVWDGWLQEQSAAARAYSARQGRTWLGLVSTWFPNIAACTDCCTLVSSTWISYLVNSSEISPLILLVLSVLTRRYVNHCWLQLCDICVFYCRCCKLDQLLTVHWGNIFVYSRWRKSKRCILLGLDIFAENVLELPELSMLRSSDPCPHRFSQSMTLDTPASGIESVWPPSGTSYKSPALPAHAHQCGCTGPILWSSSPAHTIHPPVRYLLPTRSCPACFHAYAFQESYI